MKLLHKIKTIILNVNTYFFLKENNKKKISFMFNVDIFLMYPLNKECLKVIKFVIWFSRKTVSSNHYTELFQNHS